jgi:RND family efflux transporter MFP subunit
MRVTLAATHLRRWLPWAVVGALAVVAWGLWAQGRDAGGTGPKRAAAPAPVRVATVGQEDVVAEVQAVGMVQAAAQVVVRPRVEGLLASVAFREGQLLRQGEVIARLDDREARAEVARWQAEVDRLTHQLTLARADQQRYDDLASQAAVSTQQRDQQAAQTRQIDAQRRAAQASLAAAKVQLDHTVIRAPISGRAGLKGVDPGNLVRPSDERGLLTITRLDPVHVVFAVPQARWQAVREALQTPGGDAVPVRLSEGPEGAQNATAGAAAPLMGRVLTRDNQIDAATGTLRLKAEFANTDERLLPGQPVTVRLPVQTWRQTLVVPAAALQQGLRGPMVWRLKPGDGAPQAEPVWIEVRWQDDARVAVVSGLAAGDRVVVDGHARLKPGAPVRVLTQEGAKEGTQEGRDGDSR